MRSFNKSGFVRNLLFQIGFLIASSMSYAQVLGKVYHDINANGTQESSNPTELSMSNVIVTAYKPDGTSVSTTTSSTGNYTFTEVQVPSGTKVRIEFTGLSSVSSERTVGGTTVQFVTAGASATDINLGFSFADDQCQSNPMMVTPCYVESGASNLDVMVKFSYNNTGTAPLDKVSITNSGQVGSLWGVAYSRSKKLVYTSAVLKGHIPLGAEGLDAIYTVDPNAASPNAIRWLELTDDLGIAVSPISANPQYLTNAARGVTASPQNDADAFNDVGKIGLGDIELSSDEKTLYVVNLYDKKVYAIDVATKTLMGTYTIPTPTCSNGTSRPFGLGEYEGKIFVGVICDGSGSGNPAVLTDNSGVSNLTATVYRLDDGSFSSVLSFPLDYEREVPFQYSDGCDDIKFWKPWISTVPTTCADGRVGYPTPLMTDIEFDDNGHMILGFTDRTGFQFGHQNYGPTDTILYSTYAGGDILKACKLGTTWAIENSVSGCNSIDGLAIGTNDAVGYVMSWGNLAKAGEFYEGDFFHSDGNFDGSGLSYYPSHPEVTIGGLAVVPGTGEVMSTSYDPVTGASNYSTGGVITLSNTTGKRTRNGFQLYATAIDSLTQAKGVGLGDLEALCDGAPIEVGNRVWNDMDNDGIQDPDENGIGDVCLEIFADFDNNGTPDGAALGSTTTSNTGTWTFNATNITDGDPSVSGSQIGVQPYKKYLIRVCASDWTGGSGTGDLTGMGLSIPNADNSANGDVRDNDATNLSEIPTISFTTSSFGISDFSLDFGFKACNPPSISNVSFDTATCTGGVANANAAVHVTGIVGMASYAYSTDGTTNGLFAATATASTGSSIDLTGISNPASATTYTFRIWGTDTTCFNDTTVVLNPSTCGVVVVCTAPTITNVAADTATCTGGVANADAAVHVTGITGMASYAYTTDGTTNGLFAATATASTASSIDLTGLSNPSSSTTYTFRIWGMDTTCFNDTMVVLNPSTCGSLCTRINIQPAGLPGGFVGTAYTAQVSASGGTAPYRFEWYVDSTGVLPQGLSMDSTGLVSGTPTSVGSYSVKIVVVDANVCADTLDPATIDIRCEPITAGTVSSIQATCNGATANNDAQISLNGWTNSVRVAYGTTGTTGLTYATATPILGGSLTIQNLANPLATTTYTLRLFGADSTCFKDTIVTLEPRTCSATCVAPTVDSVTAQSATCLGVTLNNNASITIYGVTGGDKIAYGTNGSAGLDYATAQITISGARVTIPNLPNPTTATTYTIRIFNAANDCFIDRTVTIQPVACGCPPVICPPVTIQR